jgi:hypothetical protein
MKYFLATFSFVLLVGCATPTVPPVDGESLEPLRNAKIAASYSIASKQINYVETLYRVLWLETKVSSSDYSGLWNSSDDDMTDMIVARLRQQGYSAQAVKSIVDRSVLDSANQELGKEMASQSAGAHPTVTDAKLPPRPAFFRRLKRGGAHMAMLDALRGKGYHYLLEMPTMDISGTAIGYGGVTVTAFPQARVIDLQTSKVVWLAPIFHTELYQLGGDLKKLEVDGMRKTKEGLAAGINKIDFTALWGLGKLN